MRFLRDLPRVDDAPGWASDGLTRHLATLNLADIFSRKLTLPSRPDVCSLTEIRSRDRTRYTWRRNRPKKCRTRRGNLRRWRRPSFPPDAPQVKHARPSVENGGLDVKLPNNTITVAASTANWTSRRRNRFIRRNPRRESRNVRASTATAAPRRRKLSTTTRRRAPRRGTPEARQITRRRRTRRRSSGNRCQRNSSKRSITRCSGCPPRRTTRIGSSTRSASASLWSFPPRTTVAPPQSHHQSAWLRPRPPSKKG